MPTCSIYSSCHDMLCIIDFHFCTDINECDSAAENNCTELQSCMNNPGSFSCSCLTGYRPSSTSPLFCEGERILCTIFIFNV